MIKINSIYINLPKLFYRQIYTIEYTKRLLSEPFDNLDFFPQPRLNETKTHLLQSF